MSTPTPASFFGVLLLQLFLIHTVRRIHLMLYQIDSDIAKSTDNIFRQLEALGGIRIDLDLRESLPATRNWAASPDFLMQLIQHVLDTNPEVVIECGSGTSTLILARCALPSGVTIDMFVIDGPLGATGPLVRYPVGPVLFPRLSAKGMAFLDDAKRPAETAILRRWAKEFPNLRHEAVECEKGCAKIWMR